MGGLTGPHVLHFHGPSITEVPVNEMHCWRVKAASLCT